MAKFVKWEGTEETFPVKEHPHYLITKSGIVISPPIKGSHSYPIILSQATDKDGYKKVLLRANGTKIEQGVHRLVAKQFIPNPNNLPMVNHIDEVKDNNHVSNLEWVDQYGNYKHSAHNMKAEQVVLQLDKETEEVIAEYRSLMEAGRTLGINQGNITNCLKGRCKSVGGFKWRLKNE